MEKRNVFALTPFNMQKLFLHLNLISIKEGNLTKALNTPYGVYILKPDKTDVNLLNLNKFMPFSIVCKRVRKFKKIQHEQTECMKTALL